MRFREAEPRLDSGRVWSLSHSAMDYLLWGKKKIKYDHTILHFEKIKKIFCLCNRHIIWKIYYKGVGRGRGHRKK